MGMDQLQESDLKLLVIENLCLHYQDGHGPVPIWLNERSGYKPRPLSAYLLPVLLIL